MLTVFLVRRHRANKMTEKMAEAADPVEDDVVGEEIGELRAVHPSHCRRDGERAVLSGHCVTVVEGRFLLP